MDFTIYDRMVLSTFTSLEKQSLYQLLCGAMIVDGNRDSREISIINEVNQVVHITVADVEASRKLTEPVISNCIREMDDLKKAYVAKFLAQVVLADGNVTQKEEKFFYYMMDYLNLPVMD